MPNSKGRISHLDEPKAELLASKTLNNKVMFTYLRRGLNIKLGDMGRFMRTAFWIKRVV